MSMHEQEVNNLEAADERWLPIPNYEGSYEVSDMGNVRSLDRPRKYKKDENPPCLLRGKIRKQGKTHQGYLMVTLCKNGKIKCCCVHSLVMLAFVGPSHLTVDHLNQDKSDNRLSNLEYVTFRENVNRRRANDTSIKWHSKFPGVQKNGNKWMARPIINGKKAYLGCFDTEQEAYDAYVNKVDSLPPTIRKKPITK